MKKIRFFALLTALLLLLSFAACKKEEGEGDNETYPPHQNGLVINGAPVPDANEDGVSDASDFLLATGYPLGFTLQLTGEQGYGFDTATGTVFRGSEQKSCDFSSHLAALYAEMTEHDIYALCEKGDLTYKAISGKDTADLNETYTLTFNNNGTTYTVKTDKAAFQSYGERSDISNLSALVESFSNFAALKFG